MFYVLFTYSKGRKERDFQGFRSEQGLIDFLQEKYEEIDIVQIISVEKTYRLGLIETDFPDPPGKKTFMEEIIDEDEEKTGRSSKKHAFLRNKEKESSAMENIADEIDEEIEEETAEEKILRKNKAALKKADNAIAAAEKDLAKKHDKLIINPAEKPARRPYKPKEVDKTGWRLCPECQKNKMAPWNKSDRCSECQQYKKIPKKK